MSAEASTQNASRPQAKRVRSVAPIDKRERGFWLGLACAAALHAALIVGAVRSMPRQMGEASGRPDGISVELVDAADLNSKDTFAQEGTQPGADNPAQNPAPAAAAVASPAPDPAPPAADPPQQAAEPQQQHKAESWAVDKQALDLVAPAPEQPKQSDAAGKNPPVKKQPPAPRPQQAQPKPQQKQALQLDLPPQALAPGTRGAAVVRPPGVTRSGENDEFGRGVIRALRKTIPSSNVLGRVTVRFFLSETGDLVEVRLVGSAGDPVLDQNVVFAVKQSSFPIPPSGATVVDRTFLVTYVYH